MDGFGTLTLLLVVAVGLSIYLYYKVGDLRQEFERMRQRIDRLEWLEQRGKTEMQGWDIGTSQIAQPSRPTPGFPDRAPDAGSTLQQGTPIPPPVVKGEAPVPAAEVSQPVRPNRVEVWSAKQSAMSPATAPAPQETLEQVRDLESLLGTSWLTRLGVIAIVLAVGFLLQYAFARIGPATKVGIGLTIGLGLYSSGQFLVRKPLYRNYGQIVSAGGIIAFFVSIYAAHSLFHLIGYWEAFAALVLPALLATVLAAVSDTESLAVFCILGAFSAPIILQSGQGAPDPGGLTRLYAYMVFLNVWVAGMFRFKSWHSLPISALAATWILFFTAGPLDHTGWLVEAFAAAYLLVSLAVGLQSMYRWDTSVGAGTEASDGMSNPGLWIIIAGLAAFTIASGQILNGTGLLGWPALSTVGIFVAIIAATLSIEMRGLPASGETVRTTLAYVAAAAVAAVVGVSGLSAPAIRAEQTATAFGFSVFTLLLFLGVAAVMSRKESGSAPAACLAGAAALVHVQMAYHALHGAQVFGIAAAVAWLPIAGFLMLLSLTLMRSQDDADPISAAVAIAAQGMTLFALVVIPQADWTSRTHWNAAGSWLFATEFLVASTIWIVLRERLRQAPFRADLLGAFGNAAMFFAMLWSTTGMASTNGLVFIAGIAAAMAIFHGVIGGHVLKPDDPLHRCAYLGLATTFLTIAVPLQFREREITTLAWATEALALLWTGITFRDARTRIYGLVVLALAAGKALLLDLGRTIMSFEFLLNSRMMAGAAVIAACYVTAYWLWRYRSEVTDEERTAVPPLVTAANVLTLLFVSLDLWQFADKAWPSDEHGAAQLALSLFWTVYALGAICVGMWKRAKPVRLFAMGLLYVSISKVFLYDLSGLQQPYRIISFFTLGVILLVISLLYTKFEEWLKEAGTTPAGLGGPPRPVTSS